MTEITKTKKAIKRMVSMLLVASLLTVHIPVELRASGSNIILGGITYYDISGGQNISHNQRELDVLRAAITTQAQTV